jgi:hypothetical protein
VDSFGRQEFLKGGLVLVRDPRRSRCVTKVSPALFDAFVDTAVSHIVAPFLEQEIKAGFRTKPIGKQKAAARQYFQRSQVEIAVETAVEAHLAARVQKPRFHA